MTIQDPKAIITRLIEEVVDRGNLDLLEELVGADFVNHNPLPGVTADREGFKQTWVMLHQAFCDLRSMARAEDLLADGDRVVIPVGMRGRHTGELLGVAPTGKEIALDGIAIFRVADGKIRERWGFVDRLGLLRQLGALPESPSSAA